MKKSVLPAFIIFFSFYIYATIPPKTGIKPPQHFIEFQQLVQSQHSEGYYAEKFRQRKELREQISNGLMTEQVLGQDTVFALTLLGQYSNLAAGYSQQQFQDLLFDGNSPTGTITDYYSEVSYDQLLFTGTCSGWYNMPRTLEEYTGTNNGLGLQGGPRFVLDIVVIADSILNFADYIQYYDAQNRPHIGFIAVVHSGADAAAGAFNIWSHRWNFRVLTNGQPYISNDIDPVSGQNVIIDGDYAIQPERVGSNNTSGGLITIGVFAHEFGHIFGIPDLYDTDGSSEGLGNWCLMAGGAYGGNGSTSHTPVHMSAWCKKELGWVTPVNITTSIDSLVVQNVEENPLVYRMWKNGTMGSQYFLIENRQKIDFDEHLYDSGFLIYHVDDTQNGNQNENRYLVDLEQADGLRHLNNGSGRGDAGDPFPGLSNNTRFDINTNPNSKDYSLSNTFVSLRDISKDGMNMIADFDIGTQPFIELNNITFSEQIFQNGRVEAGETAAVNFNLINISPANSSNTTVKYFLNENDIIVHQNESAGGVNGESSEVITIDSAFSVSPGFQAKTIKVEYEIVSEGNTIIDSADIVIGIPGILLISKAETETISEYYTSSLKELSINYEVVHDQPAEFISGRNTIIIFDGKNTGTHFTASEIDDLTNYISGSGRIMFTGQNIAENLESDFPDFLHNSIGIGWQSNQVLLNSAYGISGDLFGDLFSSLKLRGPGGANNQVSSDVLSVEDPLFNFSHSYSTDGSKPAGGWIRKPNGAKIIFWGFGFESIDNNESNINRTDILSTILQWFEGTLSIEDEEQFTLNDYKLLQNYPNPFNPVTIISYEVPVKSFVSLKVYDILGREIQTLVNEVKETGRYEIQFDASSLSSGVYFYKIKSDSYSEIKKMVLIK